MDNLCAVDDRHVKVRSLPVGSKVFGAGVNKYLEFDSGVNGAEILSILLSANWPSTTWRVEIYIPYADGVSSPASGDFKERITYNFASAGAGLIKGVISFPYNMFLKIYNESGEVAATMDDVTVLYRSKADLTKQWET